MITAESGLQIAILLAVPACLTWLEPRVKIVKTFSPVVLCYGAGIVLANQPWMAFDRPVSLGLGQVAIAFAIPLLLFSADLVGWLKLARTTVIAFGFAILSVGVISAAAHFVFSDRVADSWKISGMLAGVYTGGTVNMAAIATALKIPSETFILVNASDIIVTSFYLLFLVTLAGRVFGMVLRPFAFSTATGATEETAREPARVCHLIMGVALALAVVAGGWAIGQLIPQTSREPVMILGISSLAVVASLIPRVRRLPGTNATGTFALLVFCIALGSTVDMKQVLSSSPVLLVYTAFVVAGSVLLHLILCAVARIDRDTMIITSTAGIYGPAFIPPIAAALGNKEIILSGIATGLVGYAVANYFGLGLAWMLR
ncbi:MAG: DUF819 family protein [Nitrospirae bacterium]|nr:DUF819 family protein [Nitrospirota bacterium]